MNTSARSLTLSVLQATYVILRLAPDAPVPPWAIKGEFSSVTSTPDELSIVCAAENVPAAERPAAHWRALRVHGPFHFDEIGVLASLAAPLAAAQIGIFVIATFDTDYILVEVKNVCKAVAALQTAGHTIRNTELILKDAKEKEG
jgi:hypothetical protein